MKKKLFTALVVEDDESSNLLLKEFLKRMKVEKIFIAFSGHDALEICMKNPDIDLIMMDLKMEIMNGMEAIREIRKFNQSVKILVQTGLVTSEVKNESFDSGCDGYILKPLTYKNVSDEIEKHFMRSDTANLN
jgi:CheY-like chemotaxis protein